MNSLKTDQSVIKIPSAVPTVRLAETVTKATITKVKHSCEYFNI